MTDRTPNKIPLKRLPAAAQKAESPPLASEILARFNRPPAGVAIPHKKNSALPARLGAPRPSSRLAVQRSVAGPASAPSGGSGGLPPSRPPLPSQEDEFKATFQAKGLVVTHQQLQDAGFEQTNANNWHFNLEHVGLRIHAYGRGLSGSRFEIWGFSFGAHGGRRVNLPCGSADFKDWTGGSGPFKF